MPLHTLNQITFLETMQNNDFQDVVLTAAFPKEFLDEYELQTPRIYVNFHDYLGTRVELFDDENEKGFLHTFSPSLEEDIIAFAKQHIHT